MKLKHFLFLSIFLFSFQSCVKNTSSINLAESKSTRNKQVKYDKSLNQKLDSLWASVEKGNTIPQLLETLYGRNIDSAFVLQQDLILDWELKLNRFQFDEYILQVISSNEEIVYKEITDRGTMNAEFLMGEEEESPVTEMKKYITLKSSLDSVLLKQINNKHKEVYEEEIDISKFEKGKIHYYHYKLGFACGAAGSPPELGRIALELVEQNNIKELTKWLKSNQPPLKGYGFAAFKALECKGYLIPENIFKMMNHIQNSSMETGICSGCSPTHEKFALSTQLNKWNINSFVELADCKTD